MLTMAYLIGIAVLFFVYAIGGVWWMLGVLVVSGVTGWAQTRWEASAKTRMDRMFRDENARYIQEHLERQRLINLSRRS